MAEFEWPAISVLQELRLRRWARQNYVPAAERSDTWHPVVLDEMRCKDAELLHRTGEPAAVPGYVPLAPHAPHGPSGLKGDHAHRHRSGRPARAESVRA